MSDRDLSWIKARKSFPNSACIELAADGEMIVLRNSRDPGVEIRYTRDELAAFLDGAKRGEFDHLVHPLGS